LPNEDEKKKIFVILTCSLLRSDYWIVQRDVSLGVNQSLAALRLGCVAFIFILDIIHNLKLLCELKNIFL